ncbi:Asr2 protein [Candida orthopsilosis Co 90-125]|uniref:Asr2 protein n=1 Tax=Candida orthopsilosis (strain 90-125) TaxID=1136231 RepID=H8X4P8_CANO9|nr:Asr2 protein [Candida orthopsilosis Co 90-125]CCG22990.1 Asr2 protein [Candida orthopsilosis Co 90-125]
MRLPLLISTLVQHHSETAIDDHCGTGSSPTYVVDSTFHAPQKCCIAIRVNSNPTLCHDPVYIKRNNPNTFSISLQFSSKPNHLEMFRKSAIRSIRPIVYRPVVISRNYGIVDAATQAVFGKKGLEEKKRKEGELENKAQKVNLDGGRKAASKLDDAQDAAQDAKETAKSNLEDAKDGAQSTFQTAAETVKSAADTVNKKTGKVLADSIDAAQKNVNPSDLADKAKSAADTINKKTGQVLADGIDTAQKTVNPNDIADKAKSAADKINKKTGEVLADGVEAGEKIVGTTKEAAETANKKTGNVLADGVEKGEELANKTKETVDNVAEDAKSHQAKQEVKEKTKGYESLQHKGSNVEREQQRPDDGV